MAEMIIKCPACGKPAKASTGIFAKKKIRCVCGYEIDVEAERMVEEKCPFCGGRVIYDRTKKESAVCETCKRRVFAGKMVKITCPGCNSEYRVDSNASSFTCPQCKSVLDVQARIKQAESEGKIAHIRWDMGRNDIIIYKHPTENFAISSMLTVKEGQKAIFFNNGEGLDVFGPGIHTLETNNMPLLAGQFPTKDAMLFSAQVYFIRTNRIPVKWGVGNQEFKNPGMDFYVKIYANGSLYVKVKDDDICLRKFLYSVIDTTTDVGVNDTLGGAGFYDSAFIDRMVRNFITSRFSDLMVQLLQESNLSILDIAGKKSLAGNYLRNKLNERLDEFGLEIPTEGDFDLEMFGYENSPEIERWKHQESERKLRVRDEEVALEIEKARQARILAEEETEAKRKILRTQAQGEELKISAAAQGESQRLKAMGSAEAVRLEAEGQSQAMRLKAAGTAEEVRQPGLAEAEVMKAKGYSYQAETAREIGKEALKNGLPGTGESSGNLAGTLGSTMGEMAGLGISLATVGSVMNIAKDAMRPVTDNLSNVTGGLGSNLNAAMPNSGWRCSNCGLDNIQSNFCPNCGNKRPEPIGVWDCPNCGRKGIASNFCPDCGVKRP